MREAATTTARAAAPTALAGGLAPEALLSPTNGEALGYARPVDGASLLTDGERLWPVLAGIPFLRPGEPRRRALVDCIVAGEPERALRLALADQDRFAPTAPPDDEALDRLLADDPTQGGAGELSLRAAMALLSYGPVGDYFAYRWLSPTYLSGLVLLGHVAAPARPVAEYACGIGHFLRALEQLGFATAGIDIVFSKLYLARRFLGVRGALVCGDVEVSPVLAPGAAARTVFCHDAFYFFERKRAALEHLRAVAGPSGTLAVGHVHTRGDAHEAGFSESVSDYRARLPDAVTLLDDFALPRVWYDTGPFPSAEAADDALAVAWTEGEPLAEPVDWLRTTKLDRAGLRQNPLLADGRVEWPSEAWRAEYEADAAAADLGHFHLAHLARRPRVATPRRGSGVQATALTSTPSELLRDRQLVNLPERW